MTIELIHLLLLIIIANATPILTHVLFNDRFKLAVDFGQTLPDKKPVFGPSKTWRGIFAALPLTAVAAWLLGYPPITGLLVAFYALSGDLFSSFIKRRLRMPSSSMAPLLDQVPESLFPAFMLRKEFNLEISSVAFIGCLLLDRTISSFCWEDLLEKISSNRLSGRRVSLDRSKRSALCALLMRLQSAPIKTALIERELLWMLLERLSWAVEQAI